MFGRATLLAGVLALVAAPVAAHGVCGKRGQVISVLQMRYGETRQRGALPGSVMHREIYANILTGSWTILQAHPPDFVCIERSGRNYPRPPVTPPPKGAST